MKYRFIQLYILCIFTKFDLYAQDTLKVHVDSISTYHFQRIIGKASDPTNIYERDWSNDFQCISKYDQEAMSTWEVKSNFKAINIDMDKVFWVDRNPNT